MVGHFIQINNLYFQDYFGEIMKKITIILLSTLSFYLNATVYTVGDASDADCDFNEIQDAVDSGNSSMEIRVSNQKVFSAVLIDDKDVWSLDGGYATCADAEAGNRPVNFTPTEITGADADIALNIDYDTMTFNTITMSGFDIHNGHPVGVRIESSGATSSLVILLEETLIHDNTDTGLDVAGEFTRLDFKGKIYNHFNTAEESIWGAGINCYNAIFTIREGSAIYNNTASIGGGLYSDNCSVSIFASGDMNPLNSLEYGIFYNHAYLYGGGMRLDNSTVFLTGSDAVPISISHNSTDNTGGGIYISDNNFIEIVNARIDGNTALNRGGGLYMLKTNGSPNELRISQAVDGCNYAEICSSISHNSVTNNSSSSNGGGALHAYGSNDMSINQTLLKGNKANYGAVYYGRQNNNLSMEGNLISQSQKDDTTDPALSLFYSNTSPATNINYSTIVANNVHRIYNNADSSNLLFNMNKSIINDDNDADIFIPSNQSGANINCSIVHNDSASALYDADTVVGSANLITSANYKLSIGSIATDPTCAVNPAPEFEDIRAYDRTTDGMTDIGAYEFIESDDVIFRNGME